MCRKSITALAADCIVGPKEIEYKKLEEKNDAVSVVSERTFYGKIYIEYDYPMMMYDGIKL